MIMIMLLCYFNKYLYFKIYCLFVLIGLSFDKYINNKNVLII